MQVLRNVNRAGRAAGLSIFPISSRLRPSVKMEGLWEEKESSTKSHRKLHVR